MTNGEGNVAIGNGSGGGITTGDFNTAIGNWAMLNVTTTGGNTYMGSSAGLYSVGENDTGIGLNALYDSQAGYNTAIGMSAFKTTHYFWYHLLNFLSDKTHLFFTCAFHHVINRAQL